MFPSNVALSHLPDHILPWAGTHQASQGKSWTVSFPLYKASLFSITKSQLDKSLTGRMGNVSQWPSVCTGHGRKYICSILFWCEAASLIQPPSPQSYDRDSLPICLGSYPQLIASSFVVVGILLLWCRFFLSSFFLFSPLFHSSLLSPFLYALFSSGLPKFV